MATLTELSGPDRVARLRGPLLLGAGAVAATVALHFRDPHESGSWGVCPFNFLTGLECPGCGGLRAVNDLTDLDVVAALSSNLLIVLAMPVVVVLWMRWVRMSWTGESVGRRAVKLSTPMVSVLLATIVVFTVLRNIPAGAWLAP